MSIDTYMMMRTSVPVETIARRLVEQFGLQQGEDRWLSGCPASVIVEPWNAEDHQYLIGQGLGSPTVTIVFVPRSSDAGFARQNEFLASILRDTPGDACTQIQGGDKLGLLRIGTTVYLDPDSVRPEDLTENGYVPEQLIIGIPPELAPSIR